jgi:phosphoglycerol transferase MdoB-like AlkP superfamily enzyme
MPNNQNNQDGFDYTPISMWGYFGYEILFSIPCVGLILLLVFSFGGTKNINLRNFARSYFCFLIIAAIIVAIICLVAGVGLIGGTTYSSVYY